jgi:antitoxin PrlF
MFATLTSKGQLTLPKGIRDRLGLAAGSRLDFQVNEQGWLLARPVTNTALGLAGLLRRPGLVAVSVEDMNEAVLATAAQLNPRPVGAKAASKAAPKASRKSTGSA